MASAEIRRQVTGAPRVSIGLPVRNGGSLLRRALASALAQTHDDLEIIVSDNQSTDDSAAVVKAVAAGDPRVRLVHQPTALTMMGNHEAVWRLATADWFMWLQHDDELSPNFVEGALEALRSVPNAVLAYGDQHLYTDFEDMNDLRLLPRSFDTRGMSVARRLWRDRDSGWEIKGLMPTRALDGYAWWEHTVSPDWPLLTHLFVLGDVVQVPGIYVRSGYEADLKTAEDRARLQSFGAIERWPTLTLSWKTARAASDAARQRGSRRVVVFDFAITLLGLVWVNRWQIVRNLRGDVRGWRDRRVRRH
jgi:glycosyltransferase involved in cell wall biosynthesis